MTIAGIWENEYGSRMTLTVEGNALFGTYESTTGSVGRYCVTGWHSPKVPTAQTGQPLGLAIAWHSVAGGAADASWNWASVLGGQISIIEDEQRLILSHLLVATSEFPGVCQGGIFTDKLTYRRVNRVAIPFARPLLKTDNGSDPLAGSWRAEDGAELVVEVIPEAAGRFGFVRGMLCLNSRELDIVGFTDINAVADNIGLQSVALAAVDSVRNITMALGGWIDHLTGLLSLQSLTNQATHPDSAYLQTAIRPMRFSRTTTHAPPPVVPDTLPLRQ